MKSIFGTLDYENGFVFHWTMYADVKNPEVYGWVEAPGGQIVMGSSGYYRTADPEVAAQIAASFAQAKPEPAWAHHRALVN